MYHNYAVSRHSTSAPVKRPTFQIPGRSSETERIIILQLFTQAEVKYPTNNTKKEG
jgi:hypothetical protein